MNTGVGPDYKHLEKMARLARYYALKMTTKAGSGHPTSAMSATDLMIGLFFGGIFRYDLDDPNHPNNDRIIFSKGHATPLFYSLWLLADRLTEDELMTYREFGSVLEGHPTHFRYRRRPGSLGGSLSIGVSMALNAMPSTNCPPHPPCCWATRRWPKARGRRPWRGRVPPQQPGGCARCQPPGPARRDHAGHDLAAYGISAARLAHDCDRRAQPARDREAYVAAAAVRTNPP